LLNIIEQRHMDQVAYEGAVKEWEQSAANPEDHPKYAQAYANELRDTLIKANRRKKAATEIFEKLTNADWRLLVKRELQTDEWLEAEADERQKDELKRTVPLE